MLVCEILWEKFSLKSRNKSMLLRIMWSWWIGNMVRTGVFDRETGSDPGVWAHECDNEPPIVSCAVDENSGL